MQYLSYCFLKTVSSHCSPPTFHLSSALNCSSGLCIRLVFSVAAPYVDVTKHLSSEVDIFVLYTIIGRQPSPPVHCCQPGWSGNRPGNQSGFLQYIVSMAGVLLRDFTGCAVRWNTPSVLISSFWQIATSESENKFFGHPSTESMTSVSMSMISVVRHIQISL